MCCPFWVWLICPVDVVVNAAALAEPGVVGSGVECGERNWLGNECECGTGRAASTSDELHDPCKRCAAVVPAIDAAAFTEAVVAEGCAAVGADAAAAAAAAAAATIHFPGEVTLRM